MRIFGGNYRGASLIGDFLVYRSCGLTEEWELRILFLSSSGS